MQVRNKIEYRLDTYPVIVHRIMTLTRTHTYQKLGGKVRTNTLERYVPTLFITWAMVRDPLKREAELTRIYNATMFRPTVQQLNDMLPDEPPEGQSPPVPFQRRRSDLSSTLQLFI